MATTTTAPTTEKKAPARTAAVVLAGFCAFLTIHAPQPLLPLLSREFHVSAAAIALVIAATTAGIGLAAPFIGMISDRVGRKRVIVPTALLLAVPATLCSTAGGLHSLLFWRFCQGLLTPGIAAVTIAYINEEWGIGAGAAMSAYVTGTILGGFSGRMIAALIAAHYSWRWAFATLGILCAIGAAAMAVWLPPDRHAPARGLPNGSRASILAHLHNRQLLATCAVGFCVLFTLISTFTYVNFYLAAPPFRLGTQALGLLFTVYLIGILPTPIFGRSIDRIGHRQVIALALSASIGGIALTLVHFLPAVIAGLGLLAAGVFIAQAVTSSYIGVAASYAHASAVGIYSVFYYAGGTIGSALPGWFWGLGGWPACVALIVAIEAITIVIAWKNWVR